MTKQKAEEADLPDFDLTLGELKAVGEIDPTWAAQIFVDVELLLELHQLHARISRSRSLRNRFNL